MPILADHNATPEEMQFSNAIRIVLVFTSELITDSIITNCIISPIIYQIKSITLPI